MSLHNFNHRTIEFINLKTPPLIALHYAVCDTNFNNFQKIGDYFINNDFCTVKSAHAVTFIKQSLVLKGHPFLVLSEKISYELNLF